MVKRIGRNEGLGQVLDRGVRLAAEELGRNSVEFAMHTNGLELPLHDPRCYHSQALSYATSNRGVATWPETATPTNPTSTLRN